MRVLFADLVIEPEGVGGVGLLLGVIGGAGAVVEGEAPAPILAVEQARQHAPALQILA